MTHTKTLLQFLLTVFSTAVIMYVFLYNIAPFGITIYYPSQQNLAALGPKERIQEEVQNSEKVLRQIDDLVYFSTKIPFHFDTATVRMVFQNEDPNQELAIGFKDQEQWHYDTQLVDVPFLNSLSWNKVGTNPVLYQREKKFSSVSDFLLHTPSNAFIGIYNYNTDLGKVSKMRLPDYTPATTETIIDTPLRGKHTMYAYLHNEPFALTIQKQDLNWYTGGDAVSIKVHKDRDLVFETEISDDGIQDNSGVILPRQEVVIKNPGPELPESGVYKITIDATNDSVIQRITTNLHKIVFQGNVFLVANSNAYASIIASTSATTLHTNALALSAMTYHTNGLQPITVENEIFPVNMLRTKQIFAPKSDFTKIIVPKNDVILNGFWGYFAFDPNQFFLPTPYRVIQINEDDDANLVDYILADYSPSKKVGNWQITEKKFDLESAFIKNGELSWVIKAPRLRENDRSIVIKDIDITFHKKPMF